jgi:glyoxylate carboligase
MADVASLLTLVDEFPNLAIVKCEANPPTQSIKRVAELTSGRVKTLIGWGGIFWEVGIVAGASGIQPGCGLTDLYLWANKALLDGDLSEFGFRLNASSNLITVVTQLVQSLRQLGKKLNLA